MEKEFNKERIEVDSGDILAVKKRIKMKGSKLWKVIVLTCTFFIVFINVSESATECSTCPPDPCTSCPPDESVPLDEGAVIIFAGAAALGIRKIYKLKKSGNGMEVSS